VVDLNRNGVKEVVYSIPVNGGNRHTNPTTQFLEWTGQEFRELVQDDASPSLDWGRRKVDACVYFKDFDASGTMQLMFPCFVYWTSDGMGIAFTCPSGVDCNTDSVWMWDGEYYYCMWTEPVPPRYRFQAALEGDLFSSIGLYDRAEAMYRRVVSEVHAESGFHRGLELGF
jgi:hypothetical protein